MKCRHLHQQSWEGIMVNTDVSRRGVLGGLGAGAATLTFPAIAGNTAGKPNILFILADDLGYADIGCFGSRHISTPVLDRLAKQGVRMTDAYANSPVCSPTRLALATGRYNRAFRTGAVEPFSPGPWGDTAIPPQYPTYMRQLQSAGYRTSLVGKWHLGPTPEGSPLNYGFDDFYGFLGGGIDYFTHEYFGAKALVDQKDVIEHDGYMTTLLADQAISRIQTASGAGVPFAINLHFNAPHWPWEGPEDFSLGTQGSHDDGGSLDVFASMVESMDRNIGRVLTELDNLGQADKTLVVFTSDNGGERYSDVWPFRGEKGYLLEGGIRVPAIARLPGRIPAGTESDQMAVTMDFYPTFMELAGLKPKDVTLDGISLLGSWMTGQSSERSLFWSFQGHNQAAARQGNWKYFSLEGNEFLFDLSHDQHERANRKGHEPVVFERLRMAWQDWDAAMAPRDGIEGYCIDPAMQAGELQKSPDSNCKTYGRPAPSLE
ncbi:sulfatase-like hydrolase/transferase [Croceibacterium salegens]|uniref:sulfatase-like hydrolase/transferase n=1 Tax=Croceibacterium salegens TaxID=1737568 RepID=UPI00135AF31A|nr:sulfatase-like hydrolase/transferase [Croceibacterium salegens]